MNNSDILEMVPLPMDDFIRVEMQRIALEGILSGQTPPNERDSSALSHLPIEKHKKEGVLIYMRFTGAAF